MDLNGSPQEFKSLLDKALNRNRSVGTVNALLRRSTSPSQSNPNNSNVYVIFGNRDPKTTNNRLSIVRLTSNGKGGLKIGKPHFVTGQVQAALPSMAIAKNSKGTIGILYVVYDGLDKKTGFPTYTANLAISDNHGLTFTPINWRSFSHPPRTMVINDSVSWVTMSN